MTHILIIEDNADIREVTADILMLEDYKISTASDGIQGVKQALRIIPDLIICDIMMPKLDGYGVFEQLQENEKTAKIPFIFLSAKSEKCDFRKGMTLGADDYITKPFEPEELVNAIETRLKKNEFFKKSYGNTTNSINQFLQDASKYLKLEDLANNAETVSFNNKDLIFEEGKPANHLYFIANGTVKTFRISESAKEFVSGIYNKGEFIGQLCLLGNTGKYTETAMVMEQAEVCAIHKVDFTKLIYENKTVSNKFIEMLSNNMIDLQNQLFDMAFTPVRQRAAKALLHLFNKGIITGETEIGINIPREDFAGIIGTATETAIRTLRDFKNEKLIKVEDGKRFILLNEKKLQDIADC
ncbi:response regulator [Bizionia arctica]|uniref:Transcriptional regulator n=1 Tax=Bizionia arctica TaxID=1495645 RepID=A0A917LPX0_9FLAO|nr:response regulator [Bizionia arctica]GGG49026.1 transcriptional regulator [Bizionia arctica]